MKGRAGRKGKDEIGETYLCCQKADIEEVSELIEADIPPLRSCLLPEKRGVKRYSTSYAWVSQYIADMGRALLEIIATKLATSLEAVGEYIKKTLLYHLMDRRELIDMVNVTLQDLEETGLVTNDGTILEATLLGQAIVASSLTPEDGIFVHKELRKALEAFVMDGEMHVLYAFTPIQAAEGNINWQILRKEVEDFDDSNMRALNFVGLKPSLINKM
jgi:DNA polymerase theta